MGKQKDPEVSDAEGAGKTDASEETARDSASGAGSGTGRRRRGGKSAAAKRTDEARAQAQEGPGTEGPGTEGADEAAENEAENEAGKDAGSDAGKTARKAREKGAGKADDESRAGSGTESGTDSGTGPGTGDAASADTRRPDRPAAEAEEGREAPAGEAARAREESEPEQAEPEHSEGPLATHADELAYHEETVSDLADQVAEARGHRTLWATMLFILVGALAVVGLTLWGAPKIAPHVPAGIAQYLVPGQLDTADRLAALEERLAARAEETDTALSGLSDRLAALESELETGLAGAAGAEQTQAAIAEVRETAEAAAADASELVARVDGVESRIAGLREEVAAISDTLTGAGEGAAPPELAAAIASLRSRVDQLAETVESGPPSAALAERLDALAGRMDELEASLAAARESESEVSSAIRETRVQSAFDTLAGRLAAGQPYAAALSEIASLTGAEPPGALAGPAGDGLATATELEATFGRHAQAAIAADIRARSGEGGVGQALGWLRAQVAGRPVTEQEGDGVPAITSRIAARLEEGRLDAALGEAEALPDPARAALGDWLERLSARVEAEAALAAWREQVAAKG